MDISGVPKFGDASEVCVSCLRNIIGGLGVNIGALMEGALGVIMVGVIIRVALSGDPAVNLVLMISFPPDRMFFIPTPTPLPMAFLPGVFTSGLFAGLGVSTFGSSLLFFSSAFPLLCFELSLGVLLASLSSGFSLMSSLLRLG